MVQIQVQPAIDCINANRDVICGVKVRLTAAIANEGKNEKEAFARAIKVTFKYNLCYGLGFFWEA